MALQRQRGAPARRKLMRALIMAVALAGCGRAGAHDTWLQPLPDTARGERAMALGTGERFPQQQSALPVQLLRDAACHALGSSSAGLSPPPPWPLRWAADRPDALWLRSTRGVSPAQVLDCQVQTQAQAIELDKAAAAAHLDETRADLALRMRWQALQQQGRPWRERYRKHARWIGTAPGVLPAPLPGPLLAGATMPARTMGLDLQLQLPRWPLQRGDRVVAWLVFNGQPLPGHAVELRNDLSPIGLWLRSDGEGRVELPLPLAARWMLRGIVLQPGPDAEAGDWDSHFLSVVFDTTAPASGR